MSVLSGFREIYRRAIGCAIASILVCCLSAHADAQGQGLSRTITVNIGPQKVSTALLELSHQAGIQVLMPGLVADQQATRGVQGKMSVEQALSKLLEGTSLRFRLAGENAIGIEIARLSSNSLSRTPEYKLASDQQDSTAFRLAQADATQSESSPSNPSATDDRAAPALEEIVVTAEKREESIQRLPIAISAFSAEMLMSRGVEGVETLQQLAPSVQFGDKDASFGRVSIRGIGSEMANIGGEPGVTISQDGVPYASMHLFNLDFFDVERVEVLRGPQGTISGRNATGGAINILSKRPTEEFEGNLKATIGNYKRMAVEGYLSGPLASERLLARLAVRSDQADGWITNSLMGEDLNSTDKFQARASFLAQVSDSFEAELILDGLVDRSTPLRALDDGRVRPDTPSLVEFLGVPAFDRNRRVAQMDWPSLDNGDVEKYQGTLKLGWDLGTSARLTATTGYVDLNNTFAGDLDGTAAAVVITSISNPTFFDVWQASQEVTLTADLSDRLDVILGALYLQSGSEVFVSVGLPRLGIPLDVLNLDVEQKLASWAGYTQWRYRLTDKLRVSAGARYTHDSKKYDDRSFIFGAPAFQHAEASWSAWTPRVALDFAASDDLTLYASVSRGFKSGGYDTFASPVDQFEPEYVVNYEAGVKANWLDRRLKTELIAFYMDYTNLQQSLFGNDSDVDVLASPRTVNANSATIKGVELELDALITDRFRIAASGTWLDARYDDLRTHDSLFPEIGVPGPAGVNVRDASGNRLVRAPEWQFNVFGEYTVPLRGDLQGVLRASYAWQDEMFFDFFNHESVSQEAYGLINLAGMIETSDRSWQFSAYVNNLTDQWYRGSEITGVSAGTSGTVPYSLIRPGLPRMYGISLARRF